MLNPFSLRFTRRFYRKRPTKYLVFNSKFFGFYSSYVRFSAGRQVVVGG